MSKSQATKKHNVDNFNPKQINSYTNLGSKRKEEGAVAAVLDIHARLTNCFDQSCDKFAI